MARRRDGDGDARRSVAVLVPVFPAAWRRLAQFDAHVEPGRTAAPRSTSGPPPGVARLFRRRTGRLVRRGARIGVPAARRRRRSPSSTEDAEGLWAVTCFVVRVGERRRGVAGPLLDGAVDLARRHGASVVEGYPVDPAARAGVSSSELYHGPLQVFERAGFTEVTRPRRRAGCRAPRPAAPVILLRHAACDSPGATRSPFPTLAERFRKCRIRGIDGGAGADELDGRCDLGGHEPIRPRTGDDRPKRSDDSPGGRTRQQRRAQVQGTRRGEQFDGQHPGQAVDARAATCGRSTSPSRRGPPASRSTGSSRRTRARPAA